MYTSLSVIVAAAIASLEIAFANDEERAIRTSYNFLAEFKTTMKAAQNLCPLLPKHVLGGPLVVRKHLPKNFNATINESKDFKFLNRLKLGGIYKPTACRARHRVAIIIPYKVICFYILALISIQVI